MSPRLTIAELNDNFRKAFAPGTVVATRGVMALPEKVRERIVRKVRSFDDFTPDNDPHGEHDFGMIRDPDAGNIFWKIDYYDLDCEMGSPDPSDAAVTRRVLTIMLASEY
ncbi:DUF3768 domain-containing protein [Nitratireductor sp. StC3]|uniref:DUF3768 domain-containing protein n=1 Tax=Nitratireductor sp. StC3 TaxID=2126741 RepID=UPI000D0CE76F|nr:DUF3768 domain-containing protein [Nitratireductor sp. StC3]PSM16684.1 hypothetical protein C7T96_18575 [Nitratireductor sp. StC3]